MIKEIMLYDILQMNASDEDKKKIRNGKIEFEMTARKNTEWEEPYLDRWLKHDKKDKLAGNCEDCSYWVKYGKQNNFNVGQWVFSFVRLHKDDEWLFISAAEIRSISTERAETRILIQYQPFFGRLVIKCQKGNARGRYTFQMKKYIEKATIKEVLPDLYNDEVFEGYDNVHLSYRKFKDMLDGKILPSYYEALRKVAGVYCLTDTNTGKLYIGSATGEEGVAQRWGDYLNSKHGGNKKLRELYDKTCDKEYFEKHFTFTLLEHFNLSYDADKILKREKYWKDCLDTINHGYNAN